VTIPEPEYLDRLERMLAARGVTSGTMDLDEIQRILAEVAPLELLPGRRYRIRTYGGAPEPHHIHLRDEIGQEFALDYPDVPPEKAGWIEFDATFERRGVESDGPYRNLLIFRVGARFAALADMDVQHLEDVS
jgi:hypothetical protein